MTQNNEIVDNKKYVLQIKPISNTNTAIIKLKGVQDGKVEDDLVALDENSHNNLKSDVYGKNSIFIKKIGAYDVVGYIYRCNIIDSYIIGGSRYPFMYLTVTYQKGLLMGSILQVIVSIDIDAEEKKKIKSNINYVNLHFSGDWIQHLDFDDELRQNYDKLVREHLENEAFKIFYSSDNVDKHSWPLDKIATWVEIYIADKRQSYYNLLENKTFNFKTTKDTIKYFADLCTSDDLCNFITIAINCREKERSKKMMSEKYVVPKVVCKLTNIVDELIANNEIIEI